MQTDADEELDAETYLMEHAFSHLPGPGLTGDIFEREVRKAVRVSGLPESEIREALAETVRLASTIESLVIDRYEGIFFWLEDCGRIEVEEGRGPYHTRVTPEYREVVKEFMKAQKRGRTPPRGPGQRTARSRPAAQRS